MAQSRDPHGLDSLRVFNGGLGNLPKTWEGQDKHWLQGGIQEKYLENKHSVTMCELMDIFRTVFLDREVYQ